MPSTPDLPEPAHSELDSMLSRRFGREVANYFSGSPLNRVSFLRTDHSFLSAAVTHPTTSFLLFNNLKPLGKDPATLSYLKYVDVRPLIGENPYVKTEDQLISEYRSSITIPQLVFLGIDEKNRDGLQWEVYRGAPYFALDVTPKGTIEGAGNEVIAEMKNRGLVFLEGRLHMSLRAPEGPPVRPSNPTPFLSTKLTPPSLSAAIYAQSRAYLDWNARNPFCAQCGQPTLSINGGAKRTCPPTDLSLIPSATAQGSTPNSTPSDPTHRPPCATRQGIHNISFPRTDPTVIMAVVSPDAQRALLGRKKSWPPHWYSVLAGFVEPAESVEEAVRREVWEEAGVELGRVVLHSTQPWPYPANLMIGAIAHAVPGGEQIVLKHDPELEDAKWVELDEVAEALRVSTSGLDDTPGKDYVEGGLRLPPKTAISNQLLRAVVGGFVSGNVKDLN